MPQKLATYCCDLLFTASIPGFSRTAFSKSSDEFKGFMRNGISDIVRIFDKNYLFLSNILKGYWIILNNSRIRKYDVINNGRPAIPSSVGWFSIIGTLTCRFKCHGGEKEG